MNRFPRALPIKLHDCVLHGPDSGAELFVVEGDSAASAVAAACDPQRQAVLPLQGKPLNAARASAARVARDPFLGALSQALGTGWGEACSLTGLRYSRVLLLHDPDADGIHIGALLLMYFARWMPPLLAAGRIERIHAPIGEVLDDPALGADSPRSLAYSEPHFLALCQTARANHGQAMVARRYRGLGGLAPGVLQTHCLAPTSRLARVLSPDDAREAAAIFGTAAAGD